MKRTVLVLGLAAIVLPNAGCLSRAIGEIRGVEYNYVEPTPLQPAANLGPVQVEPVGSIMGAVVTPDWLSMLAQQARRECREDEALANGTRPVKITGQVVHFESANVLDQVLGPQPQVVVQVTCTDAATGQVLGVANVLGRARGTSSSDQESLTKGAAKALVKWLGEAQERYDAAQKPG